MRSRGAATGRRLARRALIGTACGEATGDPNEVAFGYIPDFNGTSLLAIAEDQGLWEKHGLDVDDHVVHERAAADPGARHG